MSSERTFAARTWAICALSCLVTCMICCSALPSSAGNSESLSYVRAHQAPDGGFFEPGREGAGQDSTTAWCIMALRAAGVDPGSVRDGGPSPVDFLSTQSGNWKSVTDYERTLLAAVAGGADPRSFGGVDLVGVVTSYQRGGGNIGDAVNSNAFGILAYLAAGLDIPAGAVAWQESAQNADGGWGNNPGGASNPDMTGASIMALRAAGVDAGDPSIAAGLSYLHSIQAPDGGFSYQAGSSDVAATAWCVQAIIAAGQDPGGAGWSKDGSTPRGYLLSMQAADGHFVWTAGRDMNPVWTTAYAVCALAGKPYPVATVPTRSSASEGGETELPDAPAAGDSAVSVPETAAEENGQTGEAGEAQQIVAAGQEAEWAAGPVEVEESVPVVSGSRQEQESFAWLWWLAGALGVVAITAAAWFLLRRRRVEESRGSASAPD